MSNQVNQISLLTDGRKLTIKYENHIARSGEVSAALRPFPDCASLYEEVQRSEITLRSAKMAWETAADCLSTARTDEERTRKQLLDMCRSTVTIAEGEQYQGLKDILVSDANDEASIAARLAEEIKGLPHLGQPLCDALTALRSKLLAREIAHKEATAAVQTTTRDFGQAFYRAGAVLAQAKAALFAFGVKVADKKSGKKKKPTLSKTEQIPLAA